MTRAGQAAAASLGRAASTGAATPAQAPRHGAVPGPAEAATPAQAAAAGIAAALAEAGTPLLTGVPGGGPNLDVIGAAAAAGLPFVLAHTETAAAIMAATCADLTGTAGAVVVTRGPGLASAINGMAHAALDGLPLVVVADTVPAAEANRISHQRLDQEALGRPVAKAVVTVGRDRPGEAARRAVQLALAPPAGPVLINMDATTTAASLPDNSKQNPEDAAPEDAAPEDAAPEDAAPEDAAPEDAAFPPDNSKFSPAAGAAEVLPDNSKRNQGGGGLASLADALRRARRPLVLLGPGALTHTTAVRGALAGSGIPALHTYRARGIMPDSGGEAAGLVTGGTMEWPLLAAADLVIGLGVDPVEMIPAAWDCPAPVILVSETPSPADTAYFAGAARVTTPLPAALALFADQAGGHDWPPDTGRRARADITRRLHGTAVAAPGLLAPQQVAATVRELTPPETVATVDAGAHMLAVMPLWPVDEPHRLLISSGLATMGYALPAAIAAALCLSRGHGGHATGLSRGPAQPIPSSPAGPGISPPSPPPVVAFTGDGGLGMTAMEIETAARLGLRVIVVVFNDSALSLIRIKQRPQGHGGAAAVGYRPVSFAAMAAGMGVAGETVTTATGLSAAVTAALSRPGPTVIDARVDPAGYPAILDLTRGAAGRLPGPQEGADQHGSA